MKQMKQGTYTLQYRSEFRTVENLRELTEAIEIVRDFVIADTPQKVRLALIIVDNTAELLMFQICRGIFEGDRLAAKILRPRFNRTFERKTIKFFEPKIDLMKSEGIISEWEAALLTVGHSYRNPAYHEGHHNPRLLRILAAMLLRPLSTLLRKAFGGLSQGGGGENAWLRQFGILTDFLDFEKAAERISSHFARELHVPLDDIKKTLCGDITDRLDNLELLRSEYSCTPEQWDDALKHVQFFEEFDDEGASAEYRSLVYQLNDDVSKTPDGSWGPKQTDAAWGEKFVRAERDYKTRRAKALDEFRPKLQMAEVR
jgi:hypothetical protein